MHRLMRRLAMAERQPPDHARWRDALVLRAAHLLDAQRPGGWAEARLPPTQPAGADARQRLLARARWIAKEEGLADEIARWRSLLPWLLGGVAVLVGLLCVSSVHAVAGEDRRISLLAALISLLALPTASLLLWGFSLLLGHGQGGGGLPRGLLALLLRRTLHKGLLWRAALAELQAAGLTPWVLGALNHVFWLVAFGGILAGLLVVFAFRAYTLGWETTILSAEAFHGIVQAVGWLPAQLGLPALDAHTTLPPDSTHAARAWWLLGCVLAYGLLPRVLLLLLCLGLCWARRGALGAVDLDDPATAGLAARLAMLPEDGKLLPTAPARPLALALLGFELGIEHAWPPLPLAGGAGGSDTWGARVDGSAHERAAALAQLQARPPRRALVVLRAAATPDAGCARWLRDVQARAGAVAVWLQGPGEHPAWRPWLAASHPGLRLVDDAAAAQAWCDEVRHG